MFKCSPVPASFFPYLSTSLQYYFLNMSFTENLFTFLHFQINITYYLKKNKSLRPDPSHAHAHAHAHTHARTHAHTHTERDTQTHTHTHTLTHIKRESETHTRPTCFHFCFLVICVRKMLFLCVCDSCGSVVEHTYTHILTKICIA